MYIILILLGFHAPALQNQVPDPCQSAYDQGIYWQNQFHYDSARHYFELAERSENQIVRFKSQTQLAWCSSFQLDFQEAERLFGHLNDDLESVEISDSLLPSWYEAFYAFHLTMLDQHEVSLEILMQVSRRFEYAGRVFPDEMLLQAMMAINVHIIENLESAQPFIEKAEQLARSSLGDQSGALCVLHLYQANIYHFKGDFIRSKRLFEEAFEALEDLPFRDHYLPLLHRWYSSLLLHISELDSTQMPENCALVDSLCQEGIEISGAAKNNFKLAHCQTMLGRSLSYQGKEFAHYFEEALNNFDLVFPNLNDEHLNVYAEYARALIRVGKLTEAIHLFVRADKLIEGIDHHIVDLSSEYYLIKASVLEKAGTTEEALFAIQKGILAHNGFSLDLHQDLSLPSYQMLPLYRESLEFLSIKIRLLNTLRQKGSGEEYYDLLLATGDQFDQLFDAIFKGYKHDWSKASLQEVVYDTYAILINALFEAEHDQGVKALLWSEKTRALRLSEGHSQEIGIISFNSETLQSFLLHNSMPWIEYFISQEHLYTFWITDQEVCWQRQEIDVLRDHWLRFIRMIVDFPQYRRTKQEDFRQYRESLEQLGWDLRRALIPFDTLPKELLIVPQEDLARLPFGALCNSIIKGEHWDLDYLLHHSSIRYQHSLFLEYASEPTATRKHRVAYRFAEDTDLSYGDQEVANFLTQANAEVRTIDETWWDDLSTANAQIIHVMSHFVIDSSTNEMILLNRFGDTLHISDTFAIDADLVVLAGCWTVDGSSQRGEAIESFLYKVRRAGPKSVIGSYWPLSDFSSSEIMRTFYQPTKENTSSANRLAVSQRTFVNRHPEKFAHPYYWAGLVSYGYLDVEITKALHTNTWLALLAILFIIAFLALYFLRSTNYRVET